MGSTNRRTLQSSATTLDIMDLLVKLDGARPTELADELDTAPSTVHAHLATLEEKQYVTSEKGVYDLGLKCIYLGSYVHKRDDVYNRAEKYTEQLAEETGCRAVFIVEEHGKGTYFHMCSGNYSEWEHTEVGERFLLHWTAAGKSILAKLPRERVREIVDTYGLPPHTENTITDWDELVADLNAIEERGYAINDEEDVLGIRGIGVPVVSESGDVVGAFGIGGPAEKMTSEWLGDQLPKTAIGVASEYELELSLM